MKNHLFLIAGMALLFLVTSCRKTDVQSETSLNKETTVPSSLKTQEWKSVTNWTSAKGEKFITYTAYITDSTITSTVAKNGLVLAFVKNGASINAMPYQEKTTSDSYWHYQVAEGVIIFSVDAYSPVELRSPELKYFVLAQDQIKHLETAGYSKTHLMQLTYEEAEELLNK